MDATLEKKIEKIVDRKVAGSISSLLRDPELFMELSNRSKKRLSMSIRSKKRIPFEIIRRKYG
ncbi:MAG TPA: hypothetical protein VJB98_03090 [Candidatus Paceibacterota bacterium]